VRRSAQLAVTETERRKTEQSLKNEGRSPVEAATVGQRVPQLGLTTATQQRGGGAISDSLITLFAPYAFPIHRRSLNDLRESELENLAL